MSDGMIVYFEYCGQNGLVSACVISIVWASRRRGYTIVESIA